MADEPTAHLDKETERALVARLAAFAKGRTLVMVAHRPASLSMVERVLALDAGRLVGASEAVA